MALLISFSLSYREGKMHGDEPAQLFSATRISSTCCERYTLCGLRRFMRSAGMVHTADVKCTSSTAQPDTTFESCCIDSHPRFKFKDLSRIDTMIACFRASWYFRHNRILQTAVPCKTPSNFVASPCQPLPHTAESKNKKPLKIRGLGYFNCLSLPAPAESRIIPTRLSPAACPKYHKPRD